MLTAIGLSTMGCTGARPDVPATKGIKPDPVQKPAPTPPQKTPVTDGIRPDRPEQVSRGVRPDRPKTEEPPGSAGIRPDSPAVDAAPKGK